MKDEQSQAPVARGHIDDIVDALNGVLPGKDTAMNIGRSHTAILDKMVDNGEITAEQAADAWHESHADDDHDRDD